MKSSQLLLYSFILLLTIVVVIVAVGGGLFSQESPWYWQWQHQMFNRLCHQSPDRSFWLNGQPMAVCSRCLGIYAGFSFGWLLLPFVSFLKGSNRWPVKKITVVILLMNLIDIVGNILGFWENTLVSRLVLGWGLSSATALLFTGDFFKTTIKSTGNHHGRITTANS